MKIEGGRREQREERSESPSAWRKKEIEKGSLCFSASVKTERRKEKGGGIPRKGEEGKREPEEMKRACGCEALVDEGSARRAWALHDTVLNQAREAPDRQKSESRMAPGQRILGAPFRREP